MQKKDDLKLFWDCSALLQQHNYNGLIIIEKLLTQLCWYILFNYMGANAPPNDAPFSNYCLVVGYFFHLSDK